MKIIDPEFAFYGPIGYDLGNIIAHLYCAWMYAAFIRGASDKIKNRYRYTIRYSHITNILCERRFYRADSRRNRSTPAAFYRKGVGTV
ncbi:hypothetical protein [Treponema vincentii]|uniref:hypothetical protein n=1 Tax=Treponema vincentii TaxID=69710 RepID=UPI00193A5376|nr:hypothetical protein [Treponema vincentii]